MAGRHTLPTLTPSPTAEPTDVERSAAAPPAAVPRHGLLAAEHASLATERSSGRAATGRRVGGYQLLVGTGAVSLAVAGRLDGFGDAFRVFGIVVLSLLLLTGLLTAVAVHAGRRRDRALAADQDRLQAAWLEADPGASAPPPRTAPTGAGTVLGGDAALLVLLVAVSAGALGGLVADALGGDATADGWTAAVSGVVVGALTAAVLAVTGRERRPRPPTAAAEQSRVGAEPGTVEMVPAPPPTGPAPGAEPPAATLPAQRSSSQEPPSQG